MEIITIPTLHSVFLGHLVVCLTSFTKIIIDRRASRLPRDQRHLVHKLVRIHCHVVVHSLLFSNTVDTSHAPCMGTTPRTSARCNFANHASVLALSFCFVMSTVADKSRLVSFLRRPPTVHNRCCCGGPSRDLYRSFC